MAMFNFCADSTVQEFCPEVPYFMQKTAVLVVFKLVIVAAFWKSLSNM
jgi:hypothetical protein